MTNTRKTSSTRKMPGRGKAPGGRRSRKWSADVAKTSNAPDLEEGVFKSSDPDKVAASLKQSAEHSDRRKGKPFQSAMSMLTYYINRAGKSLSPVRRRPLERAKNALRQQFGRK